jgi:hypothetical protein
MKMLLDTYSVCNNRRQEVVRSCLAVPVCRQLHDTRMNGAPAGVLLWGACYPLCI